MRTKLHLKTCYIFLCGYWLHLGEAGSFLKNEREFNYSIGITNQGRIECNGQAEEVEGRIWGPYYVYDNQVKTDDIQRLYGKEICKMGWCTTPTHLDVLRTYDSFIDSGRRLLMIRNAAYEYFYMNYYDDGTRRPFEIDSRPEYFWLPQPMEYDKMKDYYRGYPYDSNMTGADAVQFTEFIVSNLLKGNSTFRTLFNNSCPTPYTPFEPIAETYAAVEDDFDYYMVHIHCEPNQEKFWSLMVAADRYCQWNGENETLWFVGLLNLQESVPNVTPEYFWWLPPNVDAPYIFPGALAPEPEVPHAIFENSMPLTPTSTPRTILYITVVASILLNQLLNRD